MTKNNLSLLTRILIWCSGADIELLLTCSRPVAMKYAQLGFLILIPSIFAFISGSYWLSTVFGHDDNAWYIALGGGLFWGIVIFSLDRFLVMTVKKSESILRDLFSISVLSRLALAVLIGYVVAHPLVLKMFEPNLREILYERSEAKAKIIAQEWDAKIVAVNLEIQALATDMERLDNADPGTQSCVEDPELRRLITEKQAEINAAEKEYANEVAGGQGSLTGRRGPGPVTRAIRASIDNTLTQQLRDLQERLTTALENCTANQVAQQESADEDRALRSARRLQLTEQFGKKQQELADRKAERQAKLQAFDRNTAYDFLTLSNTLEELGQTNPNVLFWEKLLTAMLCAVDLLAMLIKMTCKMDEYDKKKQADEFYRFHEIDTQIKAHQESIALHLQNALESEKSQAARTEFLQQAEHTRQRLQDINDELSRLVETHGQFSEIMSLLQVMGKVPINSAEYQKLMDEYEQVVSAASMRLIAAAAR